MKVAFVDSFPNRPRTAEREFIRRSLIAIERLGWTGKSVVTSDEIVDYDPDAVIATHEFTPKLTAHPTIGLMWSPVEHFQDDAYRMRAIRSYDGYFSGSAALTLFVEDQLFAMNKRAPLIEQFAPSCQATEWHGEPNFEGLFYIGANWDGSRHLDVLKLLEKWLSLRVHGPKDRWTALSTGYAGELPFDGTSALDAIRRCGVALCLNRDVHSKAGLPSARVFEAAAAGAVVITEPLDFVTRHFGDTVFYVDHDLGPAAKADAVAAIWDKIRSEPKRAQEMARAAHAVFNERLSLEKLYAPLPDMVGEIRRFGGWTPPAKPKEELPTVEYIVRIGGRPTSFIRRCLQSIADQSWPNMAVLLVRYKEVEGLDALIEEFRPKLRSIRLIDVAPGLRSTSLWAGLAHIEAPFFGNQDDDDLMHPNHVAALMATLERHPEAKFAYSGTIRCEEEEGHYVTPENFTGELDNVVPERRELRFLHPHDRMEMLVGINYVQSNAWIGRRELLTEDVLVDPKFEVGEDVYLYRLFLRDTEFVTSWRPTIEWNWRSTSRDNSMHEPEKWEAVHYRTLARLQWWFPEMTLGSRENAVELADVYREKAAMERKLEEVMLSRWLRLGRKLGLARPTSFERAAGAREPWWVRLLRR